MLNQQREVPLEHYRGAYRDMDPEESARRTAVPFDARLGRFTLEAFGHALYAAWPEFELLPADGIDRPATLCTFQMQILVMRFLLEGAYAPRDGAFKAYRELPWGDVYDANFRGHCITRLASIFGRNFGAFIKAAEAVGGTRLGLGDVSFDIPFLGGVVCRLILWGPDEEFPPSAQFLFSGNTPAAFNAEDLAVVGDVVIRAMKEYI